MLWKDRADLPLPIGASDRRSFLIEERGVKEAFIGIPSLTGAQKAAELLHRDRIPGTVVRMPALPGKVNCAYGVQLPEAWLPSALALLKKQGLGVGRVFVRTADGLLREERP